MYNNIGKKIKGLAKFFCWFGIIASIISAIGMFVASAETYNGEEFIVMGIAILIVGPLLSWLSNFFIYGFGELIDRATSIDEKMK